MKYILMCGGDYPKFEIPKHLLKVNGEVLVERTIRLLRENGITDIAISTNNPAFDYLDVEILHDETNEFLYWGANEHKKSNNSWLKAYYPINEPVCYLHGDVYFSDEAIKTIVETKVKDTMFFCVPDRWDVPHKDIRGSGGREPLAYKVENYKLFRNAVDDLLRMVDEGKFANAKIRPIAWTVYRYLNGLDLGFNAQGWGDVNGIFKSKGDYIMINDYTNDIDDIKDVYKIEEKLKGGNMIRVKANQNFNLNNEMYQDVKESIVRNNPNLKEEGKLYVGDTFECHERMANYLTGENEQKLSVVEVIEVIPKEEEPVKVEVKFDVDKAIEKVKEIEKQNGSIEQAIDEVSKIIDKTAEVKIKKPRRKRK